MLVWAPIPASPNHFDIAVGHPHQMALTEQQKIAHILQRFGFGASETELDYYGKPTKPKGLI